VSLPPCAHCGAHLDADDEPCAWCPGGVITRTVMRPGPERLAPGLAPGGVVVHVYDRQGVLLLVRSLRDHAEAQIKAAADALAVFARARTGDVCLVVFDGDTGPRQAADVLEGPDRWRL